MKRNMYEDTQELITVVVPVYNGETRIRECINSITNQTYKKLEIIIVNDGSTDGTLNILYSLDDLRIKIINQKNSGVSRARNLGIDSAKGAFIMFVDADDYLENNTIEKMMLHYNDEIDMVLCGFQLKTYSIIEKEEKKQVVYYSGDRSICEFLQIDHWKERIAAYTPWGKILRTSIIKDNSIRFKEGLQIGEDVLFLLDYYMQAKAIVCLHEQLYVYWRMEGSLSSLGGSVEKLVESRLAILEKKYQIFQKIKDTSTYDLLYSDSITFIKMFILNGVYDSKGSYKYYLKMLEKIRKNEVFRNLLHLYSTSSVKDFFMKMLFTFDVDFILASLLLVIKHIIKKTKGGL